MTDRGADPEAGAEAGADAGAASRAGPTSETDGRGTAPPDREPGTGPGAEPAPAERPQPADVPGHGVPAGNGTDERAGLVGQPLKRHSPFYIGFFGAAGGLLAFWLGQQILSVSSILVLIVVAMFLAVGLNPLVELIMRQGVKRTWAVLAVIVLVLAALALFVLAIVPVISDQVSAIVDRAPGWFSQLRNNDRIQELDQKYDLISRAEQMIQQGGWTEKVFGGVLGFGLALVSALANAFVIIVLTLYFLASLPSIKRAAYRLVPASRRERVTDLGDRILRNFGGYVSGAFVVALAAGLSSLVFLFVVGLGEYAVALAVVVALLDVIPMIGATLGAVIVTAIGFATDPKIGLACLVFYLVYQQFENYVIYPRVMARSVDIPGSLIVVAALVGAALLGVVGALLAIPTAAALQLLLSEVFIRRQDSR
jgi:predicted PurR-regulated permease PerM